MHCDLKYDAVIFDLDGTLTESAPGITNSVKYALEKLHLPELTETQLQAFIGPPLMESFINVAGLDEATAQLAVDTYRERFSTVGWKENSVYTGIAPLLRMLKKHGAYVAVATGKPEQFSKNIIEYFGMAPYIDKLCAITLTDHHADKVKLVHNALPETYTHACMIGDRGSDVDGGVKNGIDGIGALYGYGTREELEAAGACYVAETVSDLSAYLLGNIAPEGIFISFEGLDGCGKSTQMKLAGEYLKERGYEILVTREPGGCPISERIREIILDVASAGMTAECEALLYAAARAQHVETVIKPALKQGYAVLCDRYIDSSLAYQGYGRQLGRDNVAQINAPAIKDLLPDFTLFYDMDEESAINRRRSATEPDRLELENEAFRSRCREGFLELAASQKRIIKLNAAGTIDEVFARTAAALTSLLAKS